MRSIAARTGIVGASTFALLAAVPVVTGAIAPAQATITNTTVAFTRCDVRTSANDPSTRVGPVFAWSPTITVDIDTPVEMNSNVTARFTMSDFPGGKIPVGMETPYTYYSGLMGTSSGGTVIFGKTLRSAQPLNQPIALGESEKETYFNKAGLTNWFAHGFEMSTEGWDGPGGTGTYRRYYVKCDKPMTPPRIASIPVWDPAAKAAVALSTTRLVQGSTLRITGSGFRPDEAVRITLDKTDLVTNATTDIGGVSGKWTAPAFLAPGNHTITLTSTVSAKTVKAPFAIVAAAAKASVKPGSVKSGKKTTVTASLFKPGERVKLVMTRTSAGKGLKSKTIATVTANASGKLTKKFAVSKKFTKGKHKLTLSGASSKRVGIAKLTVKK